MDSSDNGSIGVNAGPRMGLWLSQGELDKLCALVGQLKYVDALPIIQLLHAVHQNRQELRKPTEPSRHPASAAFEAVGSKVPPEDAALS